MQKEILPREKQMYDMIEAMQMAYESATRQMHARLSQHVGKGGLGAEHDATRQAMMDPLKEMENEIVRIRTLLSHNVVAPDIQGWRPGGRSRVPSQPAERPRVPSQPAQRPRSPSPPADLFSR